MRRKADSRFDMCGVCDLPHDPWRRRAGDSRVACGNAWNGWNGGRVERGTGYRSTLERGTGYRSTLACEAGSCVPHVNTSADIGFRQIGEAERRGPHVNTSADIGLRQALKAGIRGPQPARFILAEGWGLRVACGNAHGPRRFAPRPVTGHWPVTTLRFESPMRTRGMKKGRYSLVPARFILAESWGFEPQIGSLLYSLSRRAPSASRSALHHNIGPVCGNCVPRKAFHKVAWP